MLPDPPFETSLSFFEARIAAGEQIDPLVWLPRHFNIFSAVPHDRAAIHICRI
jgi:hypothetical protein